ncbi:hypothetical protein PF010_g29029 [Phytophthora fragariae]|uniref:Uncharacterized protein n=2 Tax=Phytophthora TaxID=4783 RepID=A0A6A4B8X6_9STRA|nr:hypothetical protein PF003_g24639 [Phytophthora fragariae]KAE8972652.1 hypothetical protein PR002_g26448 [Phytophthora rubi]KAE8919524.1 hypothetical protein PF009_g30169 [Phytophthora fragariae]KAE8978389.1 hypothetical protein PR001_g24858 [Phytophthora rubi]KAE9063215.1 hypothetical protein PF007_g29625 [Phytophthora fragariae]
MRFRFKLLILKVKCCPLAVMFVQTVDFPIWSRGTVTNASLNNKNGLRNLSFLCWFTYYT